MRAGVIATLIVAVVAWFVDFGLYLTVLMPTQEFLDFLAPVGYTEANMPGPQGWLMYELCRIALLAFVVLQRPMGMSQSAMYGAFACLLTWAVANIPMAMWLNMPMDMTHMLKEIVAMVASGAIFGLLITVLFKKLGGGS